MPCVIASFYEANQLRAGDVPIPEGFDGTRKSFTLQPPAGSPDDVGSIGCLIPGLTCLRSKV